jgi:hypothetical protein
MHMAHMLRSVHNQPITFELLMLAKYTVAGHGVLSARETVAVHRF